MPTATSGTTGRNITHRCHHTAGCESRYLCTCRITTAGGQSVEGCAATHRTACINCIAGARRQFRAAEQQRHLRVRPRYGVGHHMCTVRPQDTEKRGATARTAIDNRALCTDVQCLYTALGYLWRYGQ